MKKEKKFLYLGALGVLAVGSLVAGASPLFLLLLACPVMMMFMMRGMGHGTSHTDEHTAGKPTNEM